MPIYDYICASCKHRTEVIHGIHEAGPRFCPNCGAAGTLTKAFSTPAVHFKGSGWAKKDRSSASSARTKAAAGSATDGTGSSSAAESAAPAASGGDAGASSSTDTAKPAKSSED